MDIPDALKKLTADDEPKLAFVATLLHDDTGGIIVKWLAFLDDQLLKEVLLAYRKGGEAARLTEEKVATMSLDKKLRKLSSLPIDRASVSLRDRIVARLTPLRELRNKAAHKAGLTSTEAEELYAEPQYRRVLTNFPHDFEAECAEIQAMLQELSTHPDFTDET